MSKIVKLRLSERYFLLFISSLFFGKESTEICRLLSEKGPSGRFFAPDKLKNHTNERKRNEKQKERGGRKEEKSNGYTLIFYISYFGGRFWPRKNCLTKDVYLAVVYVTFLKIRKFIFPYVLSLFSRRSPVVSSLA